VYSRRTDLSMHKNTLETKIKTSDKIELETCHRRPSCHSATLAKPITLKYDGRHLKTEDCPGFFSDISFMIRGQADEGEDVQLWMFIYIQRGAEIIVDGDFTQTSNHESWV
jgi:hypothetical protein